MPPSMTVRRAGPDDLEVVVAGNTGLAQETEDLELDAARLSAGVREVLKHPSRGFYLLGERGGQVVGQLMLTTEWSDWRNGEFWWIQSVYVHPDARRTGVYRGLYEQVLALAREHGNVCGVRLYVEHENERAQQTYAALGMQRSCYAMFEVDFVLSRHG